MKIEHGVALPLKNRSQYPWKQMKPGDSFSISCLDEKPNKVQTKLSASAARGLGAGNYATRMEGDCVRVWRTK